MLGRLHWTQRNEAPYETQAPSAGEPHELPMYAG